MSILKRTEKTYKFSYEGLAQCKAENSLKGKLSNYDVVNFVLLLGVVVIGASLIIDPMSDMVAFRTENQLSQIAYKTLNGVL